MGASARLQISMVLAMLIGLGYVVWLAWAEGWRLWVVLAVMVLVGLIGGAVHMAMGLARSRDGLESGGAGDDPVRAERPAPGEEAS